MGEELVRGSVHSIPRRGQPQGWWGLVCHYRGWKWFGGVPKVQPSSPAPPESSQYSPHTPARGEGLVHSETQQDGQQMRGQPLLTQPWLAHQAKPNPPATLPVGPGGGILSCVPEALSPSPIGFRGPNVRLGTWEGVGERVRGKGRIGGTEVGEQGPRTRLWAGGRGGGPCGRFWNRWSGTVTTAVWGQSRDVGVQQRPA